MASSCTNAVMKKPEKKPKKKMFTEVETSSLLQIWASTSIQKQFSTQTRHQLVYNTIARHMQKMGFMCTADEVKNKLNNLKAEYRKKKPRSGSSPPDWVFYNTLHSVLGQRDADNDDLVDDTLDDTREIDNIIDENGSDFVPNTNTDSTDFGEADSLSDGDAEQNEHAENIATTQPIDKKRASSIHSTKRKLVQSAPPASTAKRFQIVSKRSSRIRSDENRLVESMIASEKVFEQRLVAIHEQDKRNDERDDVIAKSMSRFLNAYASIAEHTIQEKMLKNTEPTSTASKLNIAGKRPENVCTTVTNTRTQMRNNSGASCQINNRPKDFETYAIVDSQVVLDNIESNFEDMDDLPEFTYVEVENEGGNGSESDQNVTKACASSSRLFDKSERNSCFTDQEDIERSHTPHNDTDSQPIDLFKKRGTFSSAKPRSQPVQSHRIDKSLLFTSRTQPSHYFGPGRNSQKD